MSGVDSRKISMERWARIGNAGQMLRAPSAERNRQDILEALRPILPPHGKVLEVASGTGQHVVYLAEHLPGLTWQPTEAAPALLASIEGWRAAAGLPQVLPPLPLDVTSALWPVTEADVVLCINMIHIVPWAACEGLLAGAGRILSSGRLLVLYGAYFIDGRPTAPSNVEFDAMLRAHDPSWGVRRLHDVNAAALHHGLEPEQVVDMPGNNFMVVYRKSGVLAKPVE